MLGDKDVQATVAVKRLETARPFYEGVLGLTPLGGAEMGVQAYEAGSAVVLVYESEFAGTNQATVLTWPLGQGFDGEMTVLRGKGVSFERYDMEGASFEDGAHVFGELKVAWFKDPDGNILSIGNYAQ
jgi:catechol 2,3-dioxygenase-like lactoylglutathione lyase family enzyme